MNPASLQLGIVSDEITVDFPEAVRHALGWGIMRFEIRCLRTGRIPAVDPAEWEEVLRCARENHLAITALSPGVFKHTLGKRAELEREILETLPRTITLAHQSHTNTIIVFGIQREKDEPASRYAEAVDILRKAAALAEREGVKLAIENEPGFWCDTGANTMRLIKDVGSPALGANWDPANAIGSSVEVPFPDGYEALKSAIINVHAKDTKRGALIECVPIGEGLIDWPGQLAALVRDRIVGHITIETHKIPLVETSRQNVETLRRMLGEITPHRG